MAIEATASACRQPVAAIRPGQAAILADVDAAVVAVVHAAGRGSRHDERMVIGAVLLGSLQQAAIVTISSAVSLLMVGLLLVGFVIIAPNARLIASVSLASLYCVEVPCALM